MRFYNTYAIGPRSGVISRRSRIAEGSQSRRVGEWVGRGCFPDVTPYFPYIHDNKERDSFSHPRTVARGEGRVREIGQRAGEDPCLDPPGDPRRRPRASQYPQWLRRGPPPLTPPLGDARLFVSHPISRRGLGGCMNAADGSPLPERFCAHVNCDSPVNPSAVFVTNLKMTGLRPWMIDTLEPVQ